MRMVRWPLVALLCAFAVIVGAPSSVADPSPDPDLAQSVAAHEEWSNEASEISVGHVDLGPRLIDGQWRAGLRHDAESGAVWRDPNQTVLRVGDAAVMTAPDSADYPFLADVAGKPVYVVPQTQNPGVVWLGTYTATVTFLGTTTAGEAVSASTTLRFAVGDAASASEALAMAAPAAAPADGASASSSSSGDAPAGSGDADPAGSSSAAGAASGGLPDWAFLAIIAVAAASLLVIGALVVARSRRSRAEQAAAIAEADSILAPLPTARGDESAEGPGLVDRGGEQ